MIKLVSQFDDEKTRVSLATPTCGGCCCCCCCLISTIAIRRISSRNFGELVKETCPGDTDKIRAAEKVGKIWPIIWLILFIVITPVLGDNLPDELFYRCNVSCYYIISNNWFSDIISYI